MDFSKVRNWFDGFDWRLRATVNAAALTVVFMGLLYLVGLWPDPAAISAALIVACVISALMFRAARSFFRRMDWRLGAILIATALAVAATLIVFATGIGRKPETFFGAIFAGRISGIALFAVVGVVVAAVSLARPEEESVDARARILFRGQRGKHIDHIVARIRQIFEHYSEEVINEIEVREYDSGEGKYFVFSSGETRIRSYIDDIQSTYRSKVSVTDVATPPAGRSANRLIYFRVGSQSFPGQDFSGTSIDYPFDATIGEGADCLSVRPVTNGVFRVH